MFRYVFCHLCFNFKFENFDFSDYFIKVNASICEVGREKNEDNVWKWVLPYPDPCVCTRVIMGGMDTWKPIRPIVPAFTETPLLSNDVNAIRAHYGLRCETGSKS